MEPREFLALTWTIIDNFSFDAGLAKTGSDNTRIVTRSLLVSVAIAEVIVSEKHTKKLGGELHVGSFLLCTCKLQPTNVP